MKSSLPDQLRDCVDGQVVSGRYSSVSEYVRELIRNDEKRRVQEKAEALLMEGLQSGSPSEMTRKDWDEIRAGALKRVEAGKNGKPA